MNRLRHESNNVAVHCGAPEPGERGGKVTNTLSTSKPLKPFGSRYDDQARRKLHGKWSANGIALQGDLDYYFPAVAVKSAAARSATVIFGALDLSYQGNSLG